MVDVEASSFSRLGWTWSPNQRGSIDIIWSCTLALFVCVWAVLHLNLPAREDGYWRVFGRKMRWATLAVCAPEVLTFFAAAQWYEAKRSVTEMRELGNEEWSVVHGFYANAGGFVLATPSFPAFPVNATSIVYLQSNGWMDKLTITRDDIWDRSKADLFAKVFAIVQASWMLAQCIARAIQGLTITPMELFTIAFLPPTITTSCFWADKPQNVREPSVIRVDWPIAELLVKSGDLAKKPYVDTPMDFIEKRVWCGWKRRRCLLHYGGLDKRPLTRIPNDYSQPPPTGRRVVVLWIVSVIHAAIHVLAWNFAFPTYIELLLWRASTSVLLSQVVFAVAIPFLAAYEWFDFAFNFLYIWTREPQKPTWIRRHLLNYLVYIIYAVYILARLIVFIEIFVSFRSLPADAYDTVSWTAFLPHV